MRRLALVSIPVVAALLLGALLLLRRPRVEATREPAHPPSKTVPAAVTSAPTRNVEHEAASLFKSGLEKMQRGDAAGAIADYDQALLLKKDWSEAHYNRAVAKTTLKDYAGALLDYDRMIELKKGGPEAYYSRGVAKLVLGRPQEAVADFDQAVALRGDWPEAFYNRGLAREQAKDFKGAEKDYVEALRIAPAAWSSRATLEERIAALRAKF